MENTLIWLQEMEDNNESWVNISSVITMLKKEQEEAINYSQCCESDSEQFMCECSESTIYQTKSSDMKWCNKCGKVHT